MTHAHVRNVPLLAAVLAAAAAAQSDPEIPVPNTVDRVVLLLHEAAQPKQPSRLSLHGFAADYSALSPSGPSDLSFLPLCGKKPILFFVPADWDGDGRDEFVVVRAAGKKQRLDLRVYRAPGAILGDAGAPVARAKKGSVGKATGAKRVVAMGAIDVDADFVDELVMIREAPDGRQWLEIRALPAGKGQPLGKVLCADPDFGRAGDDDVVSVFGSDSNGDWQDELYSLRRGGGAPERLVVHLLPEEPAAGAELIGTAFPDLTPPAGFTMIGAAPLSADFFDQPHNEILLCARHGDGRLRVEIRSVHPFLAESNAPPGPWSPFPLVVSEFPFHGLAEPSGLVSTWRVDHRPWQPFEGPWQLFVELRFPGGDGAWVGPFAGAELDAVGPCDARFTLPGGHGVDAFVTAWEPGGQLSFGGGACADGPICGEEPCFDHCFQVPYAIQPLSFGDRVRLRYGTGTITAAGGLAIRGESPVPIGDVIAADGTMHAEVMGYEFRRS